VLASRFDIGLGGGPSKLDSPYDVLAYVRSVIGDFSAGWDAAFALAVAAAAVGLLVLVRSRPPAALLAATVFAVPTLALILARLGNAAVPETRHLIFCLPFFAMLVATGLQRIAQLARAAAPIVFSLCLAALLSAQIAWGWQKVPSLFTGEAAKRSEARHAAAAWIAETSRPDDVLLGYNPLFLEAWENGERLGHVVVPRADAKLAVDTLLEAEEPLGRGVWVHDATNNNVVRRYEIPEVAPAGDEDRFDVRAFGPFLVIRSKAPERTAEAFLRDTVRVQLLGKELGISDADINYPTALVALNRLSARN
jgi:hypothetical protein